MGTRIIGREFSLRVLCALNTPIACTLLQQMRNSIFGGCARALVERGRADLCTGDGSSDWRCVQRKARGLACLRRLHGLLPRQRAARTIVQDVVSRRQVGVSRNEVIHSELQLCIRREVGICLQAHIRRACGICGDGPRAGLRVRSQHCAK